MNKEYSKMNYVFEKWIMKDNKEYIYMWSLI